LLDISIKKRKRVLYYDKLIICDILRAESVVWKKKLSRFADLKFPKLKMTKKYEKTQIKVLIIK